MFCSEITAWNLRKAMERVYWCAEAVIETEEDERDRESDEKKGT